MTVKGTPDVMSLLHTEDCKHPVMSTRTGMSTLPHPPVEPGCEDYDRGALQNTHEAKREDDRSDREVDTRGHELSGPPSAGSSIQGADPSHDSSDSVLRASTSCSPTLPETLGPWTERRLHDSLFCGCRCTDTKGSPLTMNASSGSKPMGSPRTGLEAECCSRSR